MIWFTIFLIFGIISFFNIMTWNVPPYQYTEWIVWLNFPALVLCVFGMVYAPYFYQT